MALRERLSRAGQRLPSLLLAATLVVVSACEGGPTPIIDECPDPALKWPDCVVPPPPPRELGAVRGVVRSAVTGSAIVGARLNIGGFQAVSDSAGAFRVTDIPVGNLPLFVAAPGHGPYEETISIRKNDTLVVDLPLSEQEVFSLGGDNFAIYIPKNMTTTNAVFFLAGGPDMRAVADPSKSFNVDPAAPPTTAEELSAFRSRALRIARERGVPVLGIRPFAGVGGALILALEEAARLSGRPDLAEAPLVIFGISAGTSGTLLTVSAVPERTVGFAIKAAASAAFGLMSPDAAAVPALILTMGADALVSNLGSATAFQTNRASGALWAYAEKQGAGHFSFPEDMQLLVDDWVRTMLDLRLPTSPGPLRSIAEGSGWLGSNRAKTILGWGDVAEGERRSRSWLPSQSVAERWLAVVQ